MVVIRVLLSLVFYFSLSLTVEAKISLKKDEKSALKSLIRSGAELQSFFVNKRTDAQRKEKLQEVQLELDKVMGFVNQMNPGYKIALEPTLETMKVHLSALINADSSGKLTSDKKKLFFQLVHIARMFKMNHIGVYFCPSDRSFWVQSWNSKPKNPVHPNYKSCAKRVNVS